MIHTKPSRRETGINPTPGLYKPKMLGCVAILVCSALAAGCQHRSQPNIADNSHTPNMPAYSSPMLFGTYNVSDKRLLTEKGIEDTAEFVCNIMAAGDIVFALQEVRDYVKAQKLKAHLAACSDSPGNDIGLYMPDNDGSSMPILWDNKRFDISVDESTTKKLHSKKHPYDSSGENITVKQKWVNAIVVKDRQTGTKIAVINIHLVRNYQDEHGELDLEAPEILEIYDDEMDIIEAIALWYLYKGYSVAINGDTNWAHNVITVPGSPPDRFGKIGFVSIYHAAEVTDISPDIKGTHRKDTDKIPNPDIDVIYVANPAKSNQSYQISISKRQKIDSKKLSDHLAVLAELELSRRTASTNR